jgi:DNA invertase Pin-like site-specific DNA recombinase
MVEKTSAPLTFQKMTAAATVTQEARELIRNNILPFNSSGKQGQDEPEGLTACYESLSQEDKLEGESNSIANQKRILERYCKERGYTPLCHYDEDDGCSTNGDNEFTVIHNVFNEMYARDTSKKLLATWQSKGKSGEHLTVKPPMLTRIMFCADYDNKMYYSRSRYEKTKGRVRYIVKVECTCSIRDFIKGPIAPKHLPAPLHLPSDA